MSHKDVIRIQIYAFGELETLLLLIKKNVPRGGAVLIFLIMIH